MTPDYQNMPIYDLLDELRESLIDPGVPPMDLVVALMGYGIDVEQVINDHYRETNG